MKRTDFIRKSGAVLTAAMFEELAQLPPDLPDLQIVSEITSRYGVHFVME